MIANSYISEGVQAVERNNVESNERFGPQGSIINPIFQSTRYQPGDTINIDFLVESQHSITGQSNSAQGFSVVSVSISSNIVNAKISFITTFENATFIVYVNISNGNMLRADIFAVKTSHGVFISQNSLEDAKEQAYGYMIENGFMTLDEREIARSINYQHSVTQIMPMSNFTPNNILYTNNISGCMSWKEDTRSSGYNNSFPLQFIKIEFRDSTQTLLETTYTDVDGNYSSNIFPTGQINIRVYAAGLQSSTN